MHLQSLSLEQFRSYDRFQLDLSSDNVHLFVGPNGAGKTNILESISVLSLTKSCLGADEHDMMQWGTDFYRIKATAHTDADEECSVEVASQIAPRKQKACFYNDVKCGIAEMVGRIPTVLFLPQELELFTGAPAERRRFLDQLLCQVSPEYMQLLMQYQKIIKQRNSLLRKISEGVSSESGLQVWNHALAEKGADITLRRIELIHMLQCTLVQELESLGEQWPDAELRYERKGSATERGAIQEELLSLMATNLRRDIILQSTSVGPHRDDWSVHAGGRDIRTFASRGQQRTAVLALLFLEVSYVELQRGEKPVILLDDVFSELDDAHQSGLLSSFDGHQVIITTTHVPAALHGARVHDMCKETILKN